MSDDDRRETLLRVSSEFMGADERCGDRSCIFGHPGGMSNGRFDMAWDDLVTHGTPCDDGAYGPVEPLIAERDQLRAERDAAMHEAAMYSQILNTIPRPDVLQRRLNRAQRWARAWKTLARKIKSSRDDLANQLNNEEYQHMLTCELRDSWRHVAERLEEKKQRLEARVKELEAERENLMSALFDANEKHRHACDEVKRLQVSQGKTLERERNLLEQLHRYG